MAHTIKFENIENVMACVVRDVIKQFILILQSEAEQSRARALQKYREEISRIEKVAGEARKEHWQKREKRTT